MVQGVAESRLHPGLTAHQNLANLNERLHACLSQLETLTRPSSRLRDGSRHEQDADGLVLAEASLSHPSLAQADTQHARRGAAQSLSLHEAETQTTLPGPAPVGPANINVSLHVDTSNVKHMLSLLGQLRNLSSPEQLQGSSHSELQRLMGALRQQLQPQATTADPQPPHTTPRTTAASTETHSRTQPHPSAESLPSRTLSVCLAEQLMLESLESLEAAIGIQPSSDNSGASDATTPLQEVADAVVVEGEDAVDDMAWLGDDLLPMAELPVDVLLAAQLAEQRVQSALTRLLTRSSDGHISREPSPRTTPTGAPSSHTSTTHASVLDAHRPLIVNASSSADLAAQASVVQGLGMALAAPEAGSMTLNGEQPGRSHPMTSCTSSIPAMTADAARAGGAPGAPAGGDAGTTAHAWGREAAEGTSDTWPQFLQQSKPAGRTRLPSVFHSYPTGTMSSARTSDESAPSPVQANLRVGGPVVSAPQGTAQVHGSSRHLQAVALSADVSSHCGQVAMGGAASMRPSVAATSRQKSTRPSGSPAASPRSTVESPVTSVTGASCVEDRSSSGADTRAVVSAGGVRSTPANSVASAGGMSTNQSADHRAGNSTLHTAGSQTTAAQHRVQQPGSPPGVAVSSPDSTHHTPVATAPASPQPLSPTSTYSASLPSTSRRTTQEAASTHVPHATAASGAMSATASSRRSTVESGQTATSAPPLTTNATGAGPSHSASPPHSARQRCSEESAGPDNSLAAATEDAVTEAGMKATSGAGAPEPNGLLALLLCGLLSRRQSGASSGVSRGDHGQAPSLGSSGGSDVYCSCVGTEGGALPGAAPCSPGSLSASQTAGLLHGAVLATVIPGHFMPAAATRDMMKDGVEHRIGELAATLDQPAWALDEPGMSRECISQSLYGGSGVTVTAVHSKATAGSLAQPVSAILTTELGGQQHPAPSSTIRRTTEGGSLAAWPSFLQQPSNASSPSASPAAALSPTGSLTLGQHPLSQDRTLPPDVFTALDRHTHSSSAARTDTMYSAPQRSDVFHSATSRRRSTQDDGHPALPGPLPSHAPPSLQGPPLPVSDTQPESLAATTLRPQPPEHPHALKQKQASQAQVKTSLESLVLEALGHETQQHTAASISAAASPSASTAEAVVQQLPSPSAHGNADWLQPAPSPWEQPAVHATWAILLDMLSGAAPRPRVGRAATHVQHLPPLLLPPRLHASSPGGRRHSRLTSTTSATSQPSSVKLSRAASGVRMCSSVPLPDLLEEMPWPDTLLHPPAPYSPESQYAQPLASTGSVPKRHAEHGSGPEHEQWEPAVGAWVQHAGGIGSEATLQAVVERAVTAALARHTQVAVVHALGLAAVMAQVWHGTGTGAEASSNPTASAGLASDVAAETVADQPTLSVSEQPTAAPAFPQGSGSPQRHTPSHHTAAQGTDISPGGTCTSDCASPARTSTADSLSHAAPRASASTAAAPQASIIPSAVGLAVVPDVSAHLVVRSATASPSTKQALQPQLGVPAPCQSRLPSVSPPAAGIVQPADSTPLHTGSPSGCRCTTPNRLGDVLRTCRLVCATLTPEKAALMERYSSPCVWAKLQAIKDMPGGNEASGPSATEQLLACLPALCKRSVLRCTFAAWREQCKGATPPPQQEDSLEQLASKFPELHAVVRSVRGSPAGSGSMHGGQLRSVPATTSTTTTEPSSSQSSVRSSCSDMATPFAMQQQTCEGPGVSQQWPPAETTQPRSTTIFSAAPRTTLNASAASSSSARPVKLPDMPMSALLAELGAMHMV